MYRHIVAIAAAVFLLSGTSGFAHAQSNEQSDDAGPFLRHPAVSPDGNTIAFSYQGDIWTVPASGGRAFRLTVHEAYEGQPQWNDAGTHLAFTSNRHGNADVFAMTAEGNTPVRLTYHSTNDRVTDITADNRVLFNTERTYVQVERESEVYHVPMDGGMPDRLLNALGDGATQSPDGRFIVMERGSNRTTRSDYRGPANRDLWIYDTQEESYQQITQYNGNDYAAVWAGPRELYFISDRSGTRNAYRLQLADDGSASSEPEALTNYDRDGVRTLSASADGSLISFERMTNAYTLDVDGGEPQILNVTVPRDARNVPVDRMTMSDEAREFAVSPDESQIAYVVRGEIFVTETDTEEPESNRLTRHAYRDRDVVWVNEKTLLFTSDREGQYDVFRLTSTDPEAESLFESLQHSVERITSSDVDERHLVLSPDRDRVLFLRGQGTLVSASVSDDGLSDENVLIEGWAEPRDVTFSPDGQWIAYSQSDLDFNEDVFILPADGDGTPVNVSQHPRSDGNPVWSPDGSKLGFVSERSGNDADIWFAWLTEEDFERTKRDWEELQEETEDETKEDDEQTVPVDIDLEDIHERLVRVTSMPGNEDSPVIDKEGQTFYFVAGERGRTTTYDPSPDLYKIKWDSSERSQISQGGISPSDIVLGPEASTLYFRQRGGRLAQFATTGSDVESLPFTAHMTVDRSEERMQIFEEAWRSIANGFYDPDHHGVDWDALKDKYRPWAQRASTIQDLQEVMNLMLGEVNASHMGFYPASLFGSNGGAETGLLGVELDPTDDGARIVRVVPNSPADRSLSRLYEGDVILSVNGSSVADARNIYALLDGTVDQRTLLRVRGQDGDTRTVRIRPTDDLDDQLYREWVEDRRELTEEYSGGRLGYIHIEGMNWESFERFERELVASAGDKEGLLVDVRFNGGGWTTDYLMTVLTTRRHAYTVPRGATSDIDNHEQFRSHYPFGERLPYAAWTKPVAALCNQNSYSNAEIFSHAFKQFDLGPLVGTPTFGAVISTGGVGLIDGSFVRLPFRGWWVYETDANMEGTPATPDITVENAPDHRAQGTDAQLRRTVDELLQQLDGQQATGPSSSDDGSGPSGR
ncbi:peptidase S41 [Longibacter salinarum]|uniref:Tricorn protease homolog n=1 Tax=Longibacter salinarum TaxID=1850348 RepID=A0A2A8CWN8_9BACT|nr:S41 family peptidase [Longibacter salinarum]PEN13031.1 peptidase S41 [Longibacter salinarum]